jgi:outer membrane protein assembly factor BamA
LVFANQGARDDVSGRGAQDGLSGRLLEPPAAEGGSYEDWRFARLALGFRAGQDVDSERLALGLEAVRATDRFRSVEGRIEEVPGGVAVRLHLDPWPTLKAVEADVPKEIRALLKPWLKEIRKGSRPGDAALGAWKKRAEEWLAVWGYPSARVDFSRSAAGDSLGVSVAPGKPALALQVDISGDAGPVPRESILKDVGCRPGVTIWTGDLQRAAVQRLNRRYSKSGHLFARAAFSWDQGTGRLGVEIQAGPVVSLKTVGAGLGPRELRGYLSLPSVERYGTDFLGEAERRLAGKFQSEGRLFARVALAEAPAGSKPPGRAVVLECRVEGYGVQSIGEVRVRGNAEIKESELLRAARTDFGGLFSSKPKATPEFVQACLGHVLSRCLSLGYADARVRPEWATEGKRSVLVVAVSEGRRQELREIVVDYTQNAPADVERMREALFGFMEPDRPFAKGAPGLDFSPRRRGWVAAPMRWEAEGGNVDRFTVSGPAPFIKSHVAALRSALQDHLASTGVQRPSVSVGVSPEGDAGVSVRLGVPRQATERLRRLVVQGAERTRAEFIRAEMRPTPSQPGLNFGVPLVPSSLSGARTSLGTLGIFSSVDVRSMREDDGAPPGGESPWSQGDILLRLKERPPWNYSTAFSYDRSVGYQVGVGAQRINVGGRAQTLDFNVRAGDGTIGSPMLRDIFPTSNLGRSLDVYSVGFTDPWLSTQPLSEWLAPRGLFRGELAFIREHRDAYLFVRRRFLTSMEWRVRDAASDVRTVRVGYRFESSGTSAPGGAQDTVKSPPRSILSAPFLQFIMDTRDHPFDPRRGGLTSVMLEGALHAFGTGQDSSFVKLDLRQSWNFPMGDGAKYGVASIAARLGAARPTASSSLEVPLLERFFAGGPGSHRGVEPDQLGPFGVNLIRDENGEPILGPGGAVLYTVVPAGGQGIALASLDYRFPLPAVGQWVWGEIFADSGEVYARVRDYSERGGALPDPFPPFPHWRTSIGAGLILKLGGFPIKVEYSWDARRLLGRDGGDNETYRRYADRTRMKNLLVSAGVQF